MTAPSPASPATYGSRAHWDGVHALLEDRALLEDGGSVRPKAAGALLDHMAAVADRLAGADGVVMDLGAGQGALARALAQPAPAHPASTQPGRLVIASDIAAGPLAAIRAPGIAGLVADAARPALKPGVVDLITCLRGLWTLPDPAGVLTAMAGLLAPGGHILVQLWDRPARCRLIGTGAALLGKVLPDLTRPAGEAGPFDIDPDGLAALAAPAGLELVAIEDGAATAEIGDAAGYWREFDALAETAAAARLRAPAALQARLDAALPGVLDRVLPRGDDAAVWQAPIAWHLCTLAPRMAPETVTPTG